MGYFIVCGLLCTFLCFCSSPWRFFYFLVQESLVSEEIMHNLDTCEVTVVGEELNQDQESLEVDMTRLQQKGIEMSSSNLGMIITGGTWFFCLCRKGVKSVCSIDGL